MAFPYALRTKDHTSVTFSKDIPLEPAEGADLLTKEWSPLKCGVSKRPKLTPNAYDANTVVRTWRAETMRGLPLRNHVWSELCNGSQEQETWS
jgi:hypothetical protein